MDPNVKNLNTTPYTDGRGKLELKKKTTKSSDRRTDDFFESDRSN